MSIQSFKSVGIRLFWATFLVGAIANCSQSPTQIFRRVSPADEQRAETLVEQGQTAYDQGDVDEAIAYYSQAIETNPNLIQAYTLRGSLRFALQDYRGTVEDYTEAIALDPEMAGAYGIRGLAYQALGEDQRAVKDLQNAAELFREQGDMEGFNRSMYELNRLNP